MKGVSYTIAAQPVVYKGVRFRSSLEARWATVFDSLDNACDNDDRRRWLYVWYYEPQGFLLPSCGVEGCDKHPARPYLPDFYLPYLGIWVEVKGPASALDLTLMEWANHCLRGWKQGVGEEDGGCFSHDGRGCGGLLLLGSPSRYRAPVVFSDEGVVCWDWDRAHCVGFPNQPGGVLSGLVERDCIHAKATFDHAAFRFSAADLLAGVDLGHFVAMRRKAPRLPEMPESFPEISPKLEDLVPTDVGGARRRQMVQLPRPPAMLGCLDRAEAAGGRPPARVGEGPRAAIREWEPQGRRYATPPAQSPRKSLATLLREFNEQIKKGGGLM